MIGQGRKHARIWNQKEDQGKERVADWDDGALGKDGCTWGYGIGCSGGNSSES